MNVRNFWKKKYEEILHKFTCPECGEKFLLGVTVQDMEEYNFHEIKDGIGWGDFICHNCSKKHGLS